MANVKVNGRQSLMLASVFKPDLTVVLVVLEQVLPQCVFCKQMAQVIKIANYLDGMTITSVFQRHRESFDGTKIDHFSNCTIILTFYTKYFHEHIWLTACQHLDAVFMSLSLLSMSFCLQSQMMTPRIFRSAVKPKLPHKENPCKIWRHLVMCMRSFWKSCN